MLSQTQITAARTSLGITPASNPSGGPSRADQLQQAWGSAKPAAGTPPTAPAAPGYGERVAADFSKGVSDITSNLESRGTDVGAGQKPDLGKTIESGFQTAGDVAGTVISPISEIPGVKGTLNAIGAGANAIAKPISDFAMQNPTYSGVATKLAALFDAHPNLAHDAGALNNLANLFTVVAGGNALEGAAKSVVSDTASGIRGVNAVHDEMTKYLDTNSPTATADATKAASAPGGLTSRIQASLAAGSVDPRLAASAKRLEDPATLYSTYADQAKGAMTDVKADPPIAKVGENIGDAYDYVVKMRRVVGQQMADALQGVKDTAVDISDPIKTLGKDVSLGTDGKLVGEGVGKMTSFDKSLMTQYLSDVKDLGTNPTAGELDNFLSRVPNELNVAKAAKNITDVTNAERIIKGNLADIRSSLTGTPGLEDYAAARSNYSGLSNFLDEGSKYLGAKTGGGDYARDVSVAKSSAESILSGGKKDWLMKLEGLTGYKALDDSTLAIQAMKDAGDTRGLSLFKTIAGGGVPTPHSLLGNLMEWGANKAAGLVVGSPVEQTKAFLSSLGDKAEGIASKVGNYLEEHPPGLTIKDVSGLPQETEYAMKSIASSGSEYDALIKGGDVPKSAIYNEDGTFTPQITDHVVSDIAGKLDKAAPGLGAQFTEAADKSSQTAASLVKQGQDFLMKNAKSETVSGAEIPPSPGYASRTEELAAMKNVNPMLFRNATNATTVDDFINRVVKSSKTTWSGVDTGVLTEWYNRVKGIPPKGGAAAPKAS